MKGIFRCNTADEFIQTINNVSALSREEYRVSVRDKFLNEYSYATVLEKVRKNFLTFVNK